MTLFITVILSSNQSRAQVDTTLKEFYPLQLGDLWQYRDQNSDLYTEQVAIADTLMPDGFRYAAIGVPPTFATGYGFVRVDSLLHVRTYGDTGDTCSVYHLGEPPYTYWKICQNIVATLCYPWFMRYDGITTATVFGARREVMHFSPGAYCSAQNDTGWYEVDWLLVRGIGLYHLETIEQASRQLTGAIIDGVRYGTVLSVRQDVSRACPVFSGDSHGDAG